jgi:hypothetical protein
MRKIIVLITLSTAMFLLSGMELLSVPGCTVTSADGSSTCFSGACSTSQTAICSAGYSQAWCWCEPQPRDEASLPANFDAGTAGNFKNYAISISAIDIANAMQDIIDAVVIGNQTDYNVAEDDFIVAKDALSSGDYSLLDSWLKTNNLYGFE